MARILIVDDSQELLDVFSMIFNANAFTVRTATDKEGLELELARFEPEVVLLDVRLGGQDGRAICKDIKSKYASKNLKIVLLSASPELLRDFQSTGADDVLEKPFDISTVISKVKNLLK